MIRPRDGWVESVCPQTRFPPSLHGRTATSSNAVQRDGNNRVVGAAESNARWLRGAGSATKRPYECKW